MQEKLIQALQATGKPMVMVNCSGSAIALTWEDEHLPAILQAWYPGGDGGRAVAEVLFGEVNPSGHLPITFYRATSDLPAFTDYSMANRTYRYFNGKPLYAFGHGLSYTTFHFADGKLDSNKIARRWHGEGDVYGEEHRQARRRRSGAALLPPRQSPTCRSRNWRCAASAA